MPQVQLRFASILGAELDMLLATLIFHPQLVKTRCPNHVPRAVFLRHRVNMARVVQRMGDIRAIRIAFMEGNRHLCTLD